MYLLPMDVYAVVLWHSWLDSRISVYIIGARRHGQGGGHLSPPWKYCKVLFVLQMLSKVSLDEVFMHYFEKMSSASGGFAGRPRPPLGLWPWTPLGDLSPSDPLIAHPWKKSRSWPI